MKRIASYITLFAFSASLLINVFIVVEYLVNFHYYSAEVCEYKENPEVKCLGSCQLQNKLEDEQKTDENPLEQLREFSFDGVEVMCDEQEPLKLSQDFNFDQMCNPHIPVVVNQHFHPPKV